jgi:deazaflavin-dependent oxidoreductase (nitroreductase family)
MPWPKATLAGHMSDANDWNRQIIEEFRQNGGKVGGRFEGAPMLLLHTTGAKSGVERVNPLVYKALDGGRQVIFASKGGAPTHPDWYRNLVANPDVSIEVGTETIARRARVATGEERERIWSEQKTEMPGFAEYEKTAGDREIPVVVLEDAS